MDSKIKRKLLSKKIALPVALAVGTLSLPAALAQQKANSQTVFERPLMNGDTLNAKFGVNRDLGRAWIKVELIPNTPGGWENVGEPYVIMRKVDGLSYDKQTKQVVYRKGTVQVVCATESDFLWDKSLKETGKCPLQVSTETRKVDDGFNPRQELVGKVTFQVPSSGTASASGR